MRSWKVLLACGLLAALPMAWAQDDAAPASLAPPAEVVVPAWSPALTEIDGLAVEYAVHRVAQPRATLVFENGLMLTLDTWRAVVAALGDCCNLLAYHRAGIGRSALAPTPQPPEQAAVRLQQLLQQQGLAPPYVLVGHSLGGQYAQLFARQYPEQVEGLLLVDALPPGAVKPAADFPWYTRLGLWLFAPSAARREIAGIHALGERLLAEPGAFGGPMIRLVALPDPRAAKPEGLVRDLLKGVIYAEDFGVWAVDPEQAERQLDRLYPQAELRQLQAHHRVQEAAPEAVVAAILRLLERRTSGPG